MPTSRFGRTASASNAPRRQMAYRQVDCSCEPRRSRAATEGPFGASQPDRLSSSKQCLLRLFHEITTGRLGAMALPVPVEEEYGSLDDRTQCRRMNGEVISALIHCVNASTIGFRVSVFCVTRK